MALYASRQMEISTYNKSRKGGNMQIDVSIRNLIQLAASESGRPRKPRRPSNSNCPNGDSFCGINIMNCS